MATAARVLASRLVLAAITCAALAGCAPLYGADFGYPAAPAVPHSASVVVTDKGSDDDNPMRARVKVVDIENSTLASFLDFYRTTYGSDQGWKQLKVDQQNEALCLVNHSNDRYTEFVEVFPYRGDRVDLRRGRYLVTISRFESIKLGRDAKSCGLTLGWIPEDLF